MKPELIVITGPTASGKTKLAAQLAYLINGAIISADSRQVFRKMTIGTGKDLDDYIVQGNKIPYYLIDILNPGEFYSAYNFAKDFIRTYRDIKNKKQYPILCGGTGLYISAVVEKYRFYETAPDNTLRQKLETKSLEELQKTASNLSISLNTSDSNNKRRLIRHIENKLSSLKGNPIIIPETHPVVFAIKISPEKRREKIEQRLETRLKEGMIEEVKALLKEYGEKTMMSYGLEYKYITLYLKGNLSYDEMKIKLATEIYRFSKRQMTWFRRMERNGIKIYWIDYEWPETQKIETILKIASIAE